MKGPLAERVVTLVRPPCHHKKKRELPQHFFITTDKTQPPEPVISSREADNCGIKDRVVSLTKADRSQWEGNTRGGGGRVRGTHYTQRRLGESEHITHRGGGGRVRGTHYTQRRWGESEGNTLHTEEVGGE